MRREWDARTYDSLPLPHTRWGQITLADLELSGDETVVDIGCGTGRDTAALLDRLPRGRVVAVDASRQMLDQLRSKLHDRLDRVEIIQTDIQTTLGLSTPADAAFSVAAFHWIKDHERAFRNVAEALRPGGRFVADCGGQGNIAAVAAAVDDVLGEPSPWPNFAGLEETEARLARAGFEDVRVWLRPDPARLDPGEQLESFLATIILGDHIGELPEQDQEPFVKAVAARLDEPVIDYVRLNIRARIPD
jgi:trans-aconitate 2-methyltransferase